LKIVTVLVGSFGSLASLDGAALLSGPLFTPGWQWIGAAKELLDESKEQR
jgi:hypothetical protein